MFNAQQNSGIGNNNQNSSLLNTSLSGFGKTNTNLGNSSLLGGISGGFGQGSSGILSNTNNQSSGFGNTASNIGGGSLFNSGNQNSSQNSNIFGTFGFSSNNVGNNNNNVTSGILGGTGGIGGSTGGSFGFNNTMGLNANNLGGSGFGSVSSNVGQGFGTTNNMNSGFGMNVNQNNTNSGFGLSNTNTISSGFGNNSSISGNSGLNSGFGNTNIKSSGFGSSVNTNIGNTTMNSGFGLSNFNSNTGSSNLGFKSTTSVTDNTNTFGGSSGFSLIGSGNNIGGGLSNNIQSSSSFKSTTFGSSNNATGGFSSNFGGNSFGSASNTVTLSNGFGTNNVNSQITNVNEFAKKPFYLGTDKTLTLNIGKVANANNDYEFPEPPSDTVSCLKFSPVKDFLAATAWDGTISIYGVDMDSQKVFPKSRRKLPGCVLKCNWDSDGSKLYLACTDNSAKMWDLERDEIVNVVNHNQPVSSVNCIVNNQRNSYLLTTSWDKTIKYTDLRSKQIIKNITLSCKVFDADFLYPYAAAITSTKSTHTYKLTGSTFDDYRKIDSTIKYNNRCVTCFPEKNGKNCAGFLTGTISGRVSVNYFQAATSSYYHKTNSNYCFRCQQPESPSSSSIDLYPVNTISCHPSYPTIVCGGSDGKLYFYDIDSKKKITVLNQSCMPITATAINRNGTALVYSVGYDWSRGYEYYDRANMKPAIYVRLTNELVLKNDR